jgi:ribulose 1,5-bisphosphate synthetase/thiazole synthase
MSSHSVIASKSKKDIYYRDASILIILLYIIHSLTMPPKSAKKRVLVVGAGSAGMSCADALANHPDRFETTLIGMQHCSTSSKRVMTDQ